MKPFRMQIGYDDYSAMGDWQVKPRDDCHAAFSVNEHREIWLFCTWGVIPFEIKNEFNFRGRNAALDKIADKLLEIRPEGGRFFVRKSSVIYRKDKGDLDGIRFIDFELVPHPVAEEV